MPQIEHNDFYLYTIIQKRHMRRKATKRASNNRKENGLTCAVRREYTLRKATCIQLQNVKRHKTMSKMRAIEAAVLVMRREGVDTAFGIPAPRSTRCTRP
jgi:hypothetical protein